MCGATRARFPGGTLRRAPPVRRHGPRQGRLLPDAPPTGAGCSTVSAGTRPVFTKCYFTVPRNAWLAKS